MKPHTGEETPAGSQGQEGSFTKGLVYNYSITSQISYMSHRCIIVNCQKNFLVFRRCSDSRNGDQEPLLVLILNQGF